jgi:cell division transport system ATP-binding protein
MIRFQNVTKHYGRTGMALEKVSLAFEQGEFAFITGRSGAGKTTLLKLIYAAEHPTHGDVLLEGRSVARLHPSSVPWLRRNMGVVVQDFRLLPRRSILDNVALPLEVCGVSRPEIVARVNEALARVGLEGMAKRRPGELSGGEQQRVAIARAVVNRPSIILADEPTGNLDHYLSSDIMDLLVGICTDQGATVLVATHDQEQVARHNFREVQLFGGRVKSDRRPEAAARGDVVALKPPPPVAGTGVTPPQPAEEAEATASRQGDEPEPSSGNHAS